MPDEFVYLAEGALGELEPLARALEGAGLEARIGPPPGDADAPG